MSYQVLARKWRPNNFKEVVGQQHVLQALINALEQKRLHHAYLFSGTRGVGKTSIARLLAKCLNCDLGVSANPCGQCESCQQIEQGRFIDLIEIDAASRTKVEDTREILDNVQYKPSRARYKVYLIDEVHMLSRSSFNALLKTLEEPPEHVKFLFATTETQKLPVTILSRCLQFNLKALSPRQIAGQLTHILQSEQVESDEGAIDLLSTSAKGSMRDALSLTDQAISHGNGVLNQDIVSQMLGTINVDFSIDLMEFALNGANESLFALNDQIAQLAPDYDALLGQMIQNTHFASMAKLVPNSVRLATQSKSIMRLAQFDAELLQLYYSIMIQGRQELEWASDPQSGFEMVLLRLLAFTPQSLSTIDKTSSDSDDDAIIDSLGSEQASIIALAQTQRSAPKGLAAAKMALAEKNTGQKAHSPAPVIADVVATPSPTVIAPVTQSVTEAVVEQPIIAPVVSVHEPVIVKDDAPVVEPIAVTTPANSDQTQQQFSEEELLNMSMAMAHQDDDADYFVPEQQLSAEIVPVQNHRAVPTNPAPSVNTTANQQNSSIDINAFLKAKNSLKTQRGDKETDTPKKSLKVNEGSKGLTTTQLPKREQQNETIDAKIDSLPVVSESNLVNLTKELPNDVNAQSTTPVALVDDPALLLAPNSEDVWTVMIEALGLGGRLRQLAIHSTFTQTGNTISLLLAAEHKHLNAENAVGALQKRLSLLLDAPVEVVVDIGGDANQTPYDIAQDLHHHRLELAAQRIKADVSVNKFINDFDANLVDESIKYRTIKAIG